MTAPMDRLSPVKREAYQRLRALVTLRSGHGPAGLVLAHPVGGALFCYLPLLARLPVDLTVVGFAADAPMEGLTIGAIARRYEAVLPRKRWVYCGWSFGGAVAYEMSLPSASPVVMLDTDPHGREGTLEPDEVTIQRWFAHDLARLNGIPESAAHASELPDRYRLFAANARALSAYRPGYHEGPVTWVRAPRPVDESAAWLPFCRNLTVHEVPGADHYTLLSPEHVDVAAKAIVETMETCHGFRLQ
jgi:thioesterase domain-containing protein